MYSYAYDCSSLTSLAVPDTSGLTSVGNNFMAYYARDCSSLTSLAVPDTSGLTSVGNNFMAYYAYRCSSLTKLVLPAVGWFKDNNVNWSVPSGRLGNLKGRVLNSDDLSGWKALTAEGKTLYTNYIRDPDLVYCEEAQEFIADAKRQIAKEFQFNADTTRRIAKEYSYPADAERKILQDYDYVADTFRKVLEICQYPTDARRIIIRTDAHNADLLRRIVKQYEYAADTMRFVVELGVCVGDTYRVVRAEQVYSADALRQAIKEYEFIADTLRKIAPSHIRLKVTLSIQEREVGLSIQERQASLSIQEREVKLEVDKMAATIGDTVRLTASFKDWDGKYSDPDDVKIIIYDQNKTEVFSDAAVKLETGIYYYDYTIELDVSYPIAFAFRGVLAGKPILGRAFLPVEWASE